MISKELKYMYEMFQEQVANNDYVMAKAGKAFSNLRNLLFDGHLWSVIQQRKAGILSLDYKFVSKTNQSIADEIHAQLKQIGVHKIIRDILEAPLYGYQPIEIGWDVDGGKYIIKSLDVRKQEYFKYDSDGNLRYLNETGKPIKIPEYKILCPQYESTAIKPYGNPLLSKVYWIVNFKQSAIRNWFAFTQRFGLPIMHVKYPVGLTESQKEEITDEMEESAKNNLVITDERFNIEIHDNKGQGTKEIYNGLISFCNTEMSKAILSQTLTTELNIGSYAAAKIHYDVRKEIVEADIRIIEDTINELIRMYTELNYGKTENPEFKIIFTNQDIKEIIERDEAITKMGHRLSQEYFMKQYDLKEEDFEGKEKREPGGSLLGGVQKTVKTDNKEL